MKTDPTERADVMIREARKAGGLRIASHDEVTIAVRVCAECDGYIGVAEWVGADAHPGERWCKTDGICDGCLDLQAKRHEAEDAARGSA